MAYRRHLETMKHLKTDRKLKLVPNSVFQQDNDPIQTSEVGTKRFKVKVLEWTEIKRCLSNEIHNAELHQFCQAKILAKYYEKLVRGYAKRLIQV